MAPQVNRCDAERCSGAPAAIFRIADWLLYLGIVVCGFTDALIGPYRIDADVVSYLDLTDAFRNHLWRHAVNANWFPVYPALLSLGKAFFGYRLRYEFAAARLVDCFIELFFVLSVIVLAASVRRLMLARGVKAGSLLPQRTLYAWVAIVSFFFVSQDMANVKPDALVASGMVLTAAALVLAIAEGKLRAYVAFGFFGALAFWTKAFAFPFFFTLLFFAAVVNIRKRHTLMRLTLSLVVFWLIAGPYIWQISTLQGRFTFGDAGRLCSAWFVNGAGRFNPVSDLSVYRVGEAKVSFKHPGELLSKTPEISYYGGQNSFGSTPQWTDVSYWFDGLAPRFVFRQTIKKVRDSLLLLASFLVLRSQALLLVAVLGAWGFLVRKESFADPILPMISLASAAAICAYMLLDFEARYVAFAFAILFTAYASCSLNAKPSSDHGSLHIAVLLMAGLVLITGFEQNLREFRTARQEGANPLHGVYSMPTFSAGADLAALYPGGSEVACMGDAACWADPYWARYAGLRMTAVIETGNGAGVKTAEQSCTKLEQNPAALDALRQRHVRAIVSRFEGTQPCSTQWRPLGKSPNFFYLPL
jgi:hypothetical protein